MAEHPARLSQTVLTRVRRAWRRDGPSRWAVMLLGGSLVFTALAIVLLALS